MATPFLPQWVSSLSLVSSLAVDARTREIKLDHWQARKVVQEQLMDARTGQNERGARKRVHHEAIRATMTRLVRSTRLPV